MRALRLALPVAVATLLLVANDAAVSVSGQPLSQTPGTGKVSKNQAQTCAVTRAPAVPFVPPKPYPARPIGDSFWFGNKKLWTLLPANGTWRLGHYSPTTPGFRQKIFWWREGHFWRADPTPALTVRGKRLDGAAPDFMIPRANSGYNEFFKSFMLVGVDFPTVGCWEVTGRFDGEDLAFIILVEDGTAD